MAEDSLRITEIFFSLQGESKTVGLPTVFVRLTGCPLRCQYCDTEYAFTGGSAMTLDEIVDEVKRHPAKHITVTGGEPLAQKRCVSLLTRLCDKGYEVSLETSGAIDVAEVDVRVMKVMDLKTPASKEEAKNRWENLQYITPQDQIKFVVCDADDYAWMKSVINEHQLNQRCEILVSPSYQQLSAKDLAEWILADGLDVRFQLQLHKILWNDEPGH